MPFPSGPLSVPVDPRWSTSDRPVADGFLTGTCTITRAGTAPTGALDRGNGVKAGPPRATVLTGAPCQVALIAREPAMPVTGEQVVTLRLYEVKVRVGAVGIVAEDTVTVTAPGPHGDPELVGVNLRVLSVAHTSVAWTRLLRCQRDEG